MFISTLSLKTITIGILLVGCSLPSTSATNPCVEQCKELLETGMGCTFKNLGKCVSAFCAGSNAVFDPDRLCCSTADCAAGQVCEDNICNRVCMETHDPTDKSIGTLYVTTGFGDSGGPNPTESVLYKINEINGRYTEIGKILVEDALPTEQGITVNGMTFDSSTQTMYAHAAKKGAGGIYANTLYTLNLTTAVATRIGTGTGLSRGVGPLASNCNGDLYGWIGGFGDEPLTQQNLALFNTLTGTAEDLGKPEDRPLVQFPGLGFDDEGRLNLIGGTPSFDDEFQDIAYYFLETGFLNAGTLDYQGNQTGDFTQGDFTTYKGDFKPGTKLWYAIDYVPGFFNEKLQVTEVTNNSRDRVDTFDVGCIPGGVFTVAFVKPAC